MSRPSCMQACRALVFTAATLALASAAQERPHYPVRPVKFIVPYAAGSGVDVSMRPVADAMARHLGQAVVVDNRPGAGGIVGSQAVAAAAADGYTVGYGNLVTLSINPSYFSRLPYAPEKDFAPVGLISANPYVLAVRPELPVRSLQDLVAYGREHPGKLSVGTTGAGGGAHLISELLRMETGLTLAHVPYRTGAQAAGDMVNGQLDVVIDNISAVLPYIQKERIRAIAVTSAQPVPSLPGVPPVAQSGVPGFDVVAWGALVAPAGTPREVIDRLNAALRAALADPAVIRGNATRSVEVLPSSPQELRARMRSEALRWAEVVRRAGIKGD